MEFVGYWRDMMRWTFAHPHPVRLPDGTVLVAFYAGAILARWCRVDRDSDPCYNAGEDPI